MYTQKDRQCRVRAQHISGCAPEGVSPSAPSAPLSPPYPPTHPVYTYPTHEARKQARVCWVAARKGEGGFCLREPVTKLERTAKAAAAAEWGEGRATVSIARPTTKLAKSISSLPPSPINLSAAAQSAERKSVKID